jgi:hypothetical protein
MNATASIDAAATTCETNGGHVVRFVSESELALVTSNAEANLFWVGLRETALDAGRWVPAESTYEPGWSAECGGCFAEDEGGTIPTGELLNGVGTCVIFTTSVSAPWEQSICHAAGTVFSRETMCEREPVGTRTTPCAYGACFTVAATKKRYVLLAASVGATAAYSQCQTLGGQFAVFQSPEEREQVGYEIGRQTVVADGGAHDFWIGLSTEGGPWTWDSPGGLQPLPWAAGQGEPSDAGSRAYVILQLGELSSELAWAAGPTDTHYPLCQY